MRNKILFIIMLILSEKNIFCSENNNSESSLHQHPLPIKQGSQNSFSFYNTNIKTLVEFSPILFNQKLLQISSTKKNCAFTFDSQKNHYVCSRSFLSTLNTGKSTNMLSHAKSEEEPQIKNIEVSKSKIQSNIFQFFFNKRNYQNYMPSQFRFTPHFLNSQECVLPLYNIDFDMCSFNNLIGTECKNLVCLASISNIIRNFFLRVFFRKTTSRDFVPSNTEEYVSDQIRYPKKLLNISCESQEQFKSLNEEKTALQFENNKLKATIEELEKQKKSTGDEQIEESTQAQENLKLEINELIKQLEQKDLELKNCTEELKKFPLELNQLENQKNSEHQANIKELESKVKKLEEEIKNITTEKKNTEDEQFRKYEELEKQLNEDLKKCQEFEREKNSLKTENEKFQAEIAQLREQLSEEKNRKDLKDKDYQQKMENEKIITDNKIARFEETVKELQSVPEKLKEEIKDIKTEKERIQAELNEKTQLNVHIQEIQNYEERVREQKKSIKENISLFRKIIGFRSDEYKEKKNNLESLEGNLKNEQLHLVKAILAPDQFKKKNEIEKRIENTSYFSKIKSFFNEEEEYNNYKKELKKIYDGMNEQYKIIADAIPSEHQSFITIKKDRNFFLQVKDIFEQKSLIKKVILIGAPLSLVSLGGYLMLFPSNSFLSDSLGKRISSFIEDYNIKEKFPSIGKFLAIFFGTKTIRDFALRVVSSENPCALYPLRNCCKNINRNSIFCQNCSGSQALCGAREAYLYAQSRKP